VWSAGCANGQEAYSLAMVLADSPAASWRVVATDISTRALARTYAGRYSERELRGLDRGLRERFLRPVAGGFEVVPRLREGVEVRRHSLTVEAPPGPPGCFDAIFCRNVLIYLQAHEVIALLSRLADQLAPGRLLFLGSSDLAGAILPAGFDLVRHGDAFIHRRGARSLATPAPRRSAATASVRRREPPPVAGLPDPRTLLAEGERAAAAGDLHAATRAFRQAAFLAPDHGAAHAALGVVLEAAGDPTAAARAFMAARAALARSDSATGEGDLEGIDRGALATLLAARLETGS